MHSSVLLFLNIGSSEMILIVFVALLLFGGEKLPEIARGLGKGIRDFKDASDGVKREIHNQINSYEEKKVDEDLTSRALEERNKVSGDDTPEITHPVVENTIPVSDPFVAGTHPVTGVHPDAEAHIPAEAHSDTLAESHTGASQTEPAHTSEPVKRV
ncbi:hypothetical protein BH09BAC6_BH09BAC6_30830 [soil metagenome]|jgi:sec-independent protein translocase protein TatA